MSYEVRMSAKDVDVKIPVKHLGWLTDRFWMVTIEDRRYDTLDYRKTVHLDLEWEEDRDGLVGRLEGNYIILDEIQSGSFKNSSDGGLGMLLKEFKGSAIIEEDGEEPGEYSIYKYDKGKVKEGKVSFD